MGAAKSSATPIRMPIGHPQEMRPAAAATPSAITSSAATGVARVVKLVCKAVAPVSKGLVAWAQGKVRYSEGNGEPQR